MNWLINQDQLAAYTLGNTNLGKKCEQKEEMNVDSMFSSKTEKRTCWSITYSEILATQNMKILKLVKELFP